MVNFLVDFRQRYYNIISIEAPQLKVSFFSKLNESIEQKCFNYVGQLIKNTVKSVERKCKSQNHVHHMTMESGSTQEKGFLFVSL